MSRKLGGELLAPVSPARSGRDVQVNDHFAFRLEVGLKEREMSVIDFRHDEDLVDPVDELLDDFLHRIPPTSCIYAFTSGSFPSRRTENRLRNSGWFD